MCFLFVPRLLKLIVDCLGHEELAVSTESEKLLKYLSRANGEQSPLFKNPTLEHLVQLARDHENTTARLRVNEVMVHAASKSEAFMNRFVGSRGGATTIPECPKCVTKIVVKVNPWSIICGHGFFSFTFFPSETHGPKKDFL